VDSARKTAYEEVGRALLACGHPHFLFVNVPDTLAFRKNLNVFFIITFCDALFRTRNRLPVEQNG